MIIAAGNVDVAKGEKVVGAGWADAVAFGKRFISTPTCPTGSPTICPSTRCAPS
ncbi:hypothetical protein [Micromonospora echinospora]|uniref:hypothetical protein n=1 Tax=Micromonospora echinospora TaxID=1877 RepID=UPI001561872E|nr:hypothetical protein [Micromonospora echinospora]